MIYALAAAAEDASRRRRNYACKYSFLRNVQEPGDKTTSERGERAAVCLIHHLRLPGLRRSLHTPSGWRSRLISSAVLGKHIQ